jgi:WD40-like Beta Propeller Repeat
VWVLPMSGSEKPFPFLNESYDERSAVFSPDGHWVAYVANASGQYNVEVRHFPDTGAHWPVSTLGGFEPRWSPEGNEIYYIAPDSKLMAVPIIFKGNTPEPGAPTPLFATQIWGGPNCCIKQQYDVAPDHRFLINVALDDGGAFPVTLLLNWKPQEK